MLDRIQECEENGPGCDYPLSWSISPHLLYLAPDWLHWYYQLANQTGHDVFVLPPSGHLYAYPGTLEYLIIVHCAFIYFQEKSCPVRLLAL